MDRPRAFDLPPAVLWLSLVLIGAHLFRSFSGEDVDAWTLLAFAFIPERYGMAAEFLPGGTAARFWSPLSYAFLHADVLHLVVNLVWMASFGSALARRFGGVRFLLLGAAAAIAGAGLHYVLHADDNGLMVGASGAVSGMMAGTARFAFAPGAPLGGGSGLAAYRLPAEPIGLVLGRSRALGFVLVWFAVNLLFGLAPGLMPGASGPIAWEAHVGGFLAGLVLFPLLDPVGRDGLSLASRDDAA